MKIIGLILMTATTLFAQTTRPFDGSKWNISTGNLSTFFIQHSPVGAFPQQPDFYEPPPSNESLVKMKEQGLVADEDYVAWGAVEPEKGKWNWKQHDAVEQAMHKAGLHYTAYCWVHFPPVWLRESKECTLMKCMEHNQETNYLSIFDPKTLEYYDHFYKALSEHFGDKIDSVYACILGPYGEGNYPLDVHDWVKIGHCHEGYWCADVYAVKAYRAAMEKLYQNIDALNLAWGTNFNSFDDVTMPEQIKEGFKLSPDLFKTAQDRRRWLDFITWYHQAIIDFAEGSIKVTLKYFPKEKVRTKPGGTAAGINPVPWGTYSPGYAKMAGPYGITLQPADCQGAIFGDKWLATAYNFYHVPLGTEPAGELDHKNFVKRMFSDASAGAHHFFTYEFEKHADDMQKYIHLYTGVPGDTDIAVYCPTTLYRLGGDLQPTIKSAAHLRDLCDFDVLDELLITDGALTRKYSTLILYQGDFIDQPILSAIESWANAGGHLIIATASTIKNVQGAEWPIPAGSLHLDPKDNQAWIAALAGTKSSDNHFDGLWTTRRGNEMFILNTTDKPVAHSDAGEIAPHTIWTNHP